MADSTSTPSNPESDQPKTPAPKKRRKWPWIVLALVLLIGLLVVLLPTIAGTPPVRNFVVGKVNQSLNGKVEIANWSLGWTSGVSVDGIKVYDEQNALILEMQRLQTGLSLIGAARGDLALGETTIDGLNLVQLKIDENGISNYEKLLKEPPEGPPSTKEPAPGPEKPAEPVELPNITGNIKLNDLRGTIIVAGADKPVFIESSSVAVNIANINDPITNDVKLVLRVGDAQPGTIQLSGQADVADAGLLAIEKLTADEKLTITSLDLAAVNAFLKMSQTDLTLAGMVNGGLDLKASGTTDGAATGEIVVDGFSAAGAALKGDTFTSKKVSIPIQVAVSNADPNRTVLKIHELGVRLDQAIVAVTGEVTQQALMNAAAMKAPGDEGNLNVAVEVNDLKDIANQLPNTLNLVEGVTLTDGKLIAASSIQLLADRVGIKQKVDLEASGTSGGQPIALAPIHIEAAGNMVPGASETPDIRDWSLLLNSEFAKLTGGGPSLASMNLSSDFDLGKLQQQIGQFVSFGDKKLAGTGTLVIATEGDVRKADEKLAGDVKLNINNVVIDGATEEMNVAFGQLVMIAKGTYANETITLDTPLALSIHSLNVDKVAGGTSSPILKDETVDVTLAGTINSSAAETGAQLSQLSVKTSSDLVHVEKSEASDLVARMTADGKFDGRGELMLGADLKRLSDISRAMSAEPVEEADPIQSGRLDGTVKFVRADEPKTDINGDFNITNLTVGEFLSNEQVAIKVRAAAPDEMDTLAASADVNSSFATVSVAQCDLLLSTGKGDEAKAAGVWEMVRSATISVDAPDLAKAYALMETAMPPAVESADAETAEATEEPPLPPLRITKGSAVAKIDVKREGQTTKLNVSEMRLSEVVLRRGEDRWAVPKSRPINLQLTAAVSAVDDETGLKTVSQQITAIDVTQLAGDLAIATLSMPSPISVKDPGGTMAASGAIQMTGTFDDLAGLMLVLQGQEFPYTGEYALNQTIGTQGDNVTLAGNVNVTKFKVMDAGKVAFAEDQIDITNNVALDTKKETATISGLTLDMKSSGAANVDVKGTINSWTTRRQFKDVVVNLGYDLPQVWKIVYPMLAPETQETFKSLQIAGKHNKTINLAGSYPANVPPEEAIKSVDASGDITIDMLDWDGCHLEGFELPFRLRGGIATIAYADRPKGERRPAVATFNGGELDIGRISVDLGHETPRLNFPKDHQLVKNATINPLLGKSLGKFVNPVFANATQAKGLLSVKFEYCENLALGEAIKTPESGRMKMVFSLDEMDIANPLGSLVLGELTKIPLVGAAIKPDDIDVFRGSIKDAVVTVENGRTTQDITLSMIDPKKAALAAQAEKGETVTVPVYPLRFQGNVDMSSLQQSLTMTVPSGLLDKWGLKDVAKAFPGGLPMSLGGTTQKMQLGVNVEQMTSALLKGQLGGGGGGDPLGGLLDKFKKDKEEDSEMKEPPADESAPKPKRDPKPKPAKEEKSSKEDKPAKNQNKAEKPPKDDKKPAKDPKPKKDQDQ